MSSKRKVWLINHYAATPDTGMGGRSFYMAREFHKQGHETTLITASYNHKLHKPKVFKGVFDLDDSDGFNVVRIKVKEYYNSFNKVRVFNWFLFVFRLITNYKSIGEKPEVVICSSPSLVAYLAGWYIARKTRAKLVFEIRDIWPLTLQELGGYSGSNPLIWLLSKIELFGYKSSDIVVSNLPYAIDHMSQRGLDKERFSWIPNGFSRQELCHKESLPLEIKSLLPKNKFIVGYAGAIGVANALEFLLQAVLHLKDQKNIAFVIVGTGQEKVSLQTYARGHGLENVTFIDPLKKSHIHDMLQEFDVCYIGWRDDPMYKFGISPNKLPDYFMSGKPILHSFSGKGDIVQMACAGISVPSESAEKLVGAIKSFYTMTEDERKILGENGRRYALENLDYEKLGEQYSTKLESLF